MSTTGLNGGILQSAAGGAVDVRQCRFHDGRRLLPNQYLVQPGDYLEVRDGGVYQIGAVTGQTSIQLATAYGSTLNISTPTTNYRILRQPRILIGEAPLQLPNNFAVDTTLIPRQSSPATRQFIGPTSGQHNALCNFEILFSPSGAVVGTNAGNGKVLISVYDTAMNHFDSINRAGIVGVQARTGFIGAYSVAPGLDPFAFVESGRESGL